MREISNGVAARTSVTVILLAINTSPPLTQLYYLQQGSCIEGEFCAVENFQGEAIFSPRSDKARPMAYLYRLQPLIIGNHTDYIVCLADSHVE